MVADLSLSKPVVLENTPDELNVTSKLSCKRKRENTFQDANKMKKESSDNKLPREKRQPRFWNEEEDRYLREAVAKYKEQSWSSIAKMVPGRTTKECVQRWKKVISPSLRKGKWSEEEDKKLLELIQKQKQDSEPLSWSAIASSMGSRSCKQCRERWTNHLNPELRKTKWTEEEDQKLLRLFQLFPSKWARIAKEIPGRTENMVKCRWNTLSRREKKRKSKVEKAKKTKAINQEPRVKAKSCTKEEPNSKSHIVTEFISQVEAFNQASNNDIIDFPFVVPIGLEDETLHMKEFDKKETNNMWSGLNDLDFTISDYVFDDDQEIFSSSLWNNNSFHIESLA